MKAIETIKAISKEATLLSHISALMSWDQETYLPELAILERSEQSALISTLVHRHMTSDAVGQALAELGVNDQNPFGTKELNFDDARLVRIVYRAYSKAKKTPESLVNRLAMATSLAQNTWVKAREADNFEMFLPKLTEVIELKKEQAQCYGSYDEPYDAMLDEYEPDARASEIDAAFDDLAQFLVPLIDTIEKKPRPSLDCLGGTWPKAQQIAFGDELIAALGFSQKEGRVDSSAHPFCSTLGRSDVRITTGIHEDDPFKSLYSIVHETGHALYEQGIKKDLPLALATGTSLGVHESQSRLVENVICRSAEFWNYGFGLLSKHFPEQTKKFKSEDYHRAANIVERSDIRIYADEVTYSLHIILRFKIERGLINGSIAPKDIPSVWKTLSQELLRRTPKTNALGCLQDIHWSLGLFGYFPTYALGNLYGAMFVEKAQSDLPQLWQSVSKGEFGGLREWLKSNIHTYGSAKTPRELLTDVCGKKLESTAFKNYLKTKYSRLYDL